MERTFERAALGGGHGGKPVAAQIAVPFAVGRIGEMLLAVIERLEEPVEILLVSSVAVEHHGGNENFVMRPPELHIVLIRLGRQTLGVDKVQKSAVFLVPTGVDGVVEDGLRLFDQLWLAELLRILQQEPHALDVVTGG